MNLLDFGKEFHVQLHEDSRNALNRHVMIIMRDRFELDNGFATHESANLSLQELKEVKIGLEAMHKKIEEYLKDHFNDINQKERD